MQSETNIHYNKDCDMIAGLLNYLGETSETNIHYNKDCDTFSSTVAAKYT